MRLSGGLSLYGLAFFFFFFNDTATTEIYTLSLHDALPILRIHLLLGACREIAIGLLMSNQPIHAAPNDLLEWRSEEHTSELQSHSDLVCRLLLEKKNKKVYARA